MLYRSRQSPVLVEASEDELSGLWNQHLFVSEGMHMHEDSSSICLSRISHIIQVAIDEYVIQSTLIRMNNSGSLRVHIVTGPFTRHSGEVG